MLNFLKYISAVSLLSVSSFASENNENCFCVDAHLPSTISLLDHVQHIDSAVYSHNEIKAIDSQDKDINGYLGTFIEKDLPNENNFREIKNVYNCIITKPTTAIIRNYIGSESEAHDIEINFTNGKVTEVYKIDNIGNKDPIHDSSLIGSDAPRRGRLSLNDKIGESNGTYVTLEADGSINKHQDSIFERIENAQDQIAQIIEDIKQQKPELIEAITNQTNKEFESFQDEFNNQQYAFIQEYKDQINQTYNKLTAFYKHGSDILEEHLKQDNQAQTKENKTFINERIKTYSLSTNATIGNTVDKMANQLKDFFDRILDNLFEERFGIKKGQGSLLNRLSQPYFTQTDFIDSMNTVSQILHEYHGYAGFYIGNIEIMIFGQNSPLAKELPIVSIAQYIENACEVAKNIAGTPEYSVQLQKIKKSMSSIINFLKTHDLNKEYTLSVCLKRLFGDKFPLYEPSGLNISNYCNNAHFSEEDYGFYGWIRDVSRLLNEIQSEQHAICPDETSHQLLDLKDQLENLLKGDIRKINIIDQSTSIEHIMPDVFHKDLKNYEEILKYCEELTHNAERHSLENHILEQNAYLEKIMKSIYEKIQDLNTNFSRLELTFSNQIQSINNELKNLSAEIARNTSDTQKMYEAQRVLVYNIVGFDINKPEGSILLDEKIRRLDDPKNPSISKYELHEAAHPHHIDNHHINHPIFMPDHSHSASPSKIPHHHHHYRQHSPIFK